ncbi:MAG: pyridoxamine 5'-phosphate oxidase family protein [Actinomycetota bacterium]|nr:pyridoxamine 5'-phosphate oxidase family protein [Actinomycetota bacterium]
MSDATPTPTVDERFGDKGAPTTPWESVSRALQDAELYWLTTVRPNGRPHVTPVIGLWRSGGMHFATGPEEQKAHNINGNPLVAITTGVNTWADGLDVVVEGAAVRVTDSAHLHLVADAIEAKYGSAWTFTVGGDGDIFGDRDHPAHLFKVDPDKVLAFGKNPHTQTAFRFSKPNVA